MIWLFVYRILFCVHEIDVLLNRGSASLQITACVMFVGIVRKVTLPVKPLSSATH